MSFDRSRALELLRAGTNNRNATFRDGQEEAIRNIVATGGRFLIVQKTGWGKSFVYFIATKLLREAGNGPALLISPLLALMRNQIAAAKRMGVKAVTINSENEDEWNEIKERIKKDDVDMILISPERLTKEWFITNVMSYVAPRISLLVVDEAHCISDWGHDFRPNYRHLDRIIRRLPKNLRVLATTATANNRVMEDLKEVLGGNVQVSRGDLSRPSLLLQTIKLPDQAQRLAWLAARLKELPGSGIIYTLTKRDAAIVADWLKAQGLKVEAYTAGVPEEIRPELENGLLKNELKALVATVALGMGFDKPDLAFVFHYQMPGSVVAYYQQVGRAGRAIDAAYGVLLCGDEDSDITEYFIESAFPSRNEVQEIIRALDESDDGISINELLRKLNFKWGRIDKALQLLALESPSPIVKNGPKWKLTTAELDDSFWVRAKRLTDIRRQEQKQMQEYVGLKNGHMEFLVEALDGDPSRIKQPSIKPLTTDTEKKLVLDAIAFLRRTSIIIEPRKMWPSDGGLPIYNLKGRIQKDHQAQQGRSLCVWRDAGWGSLVQEGKSQNNRFSGDLIEACVKLIADWKPNPAPQWVTCIPSIRHPEHVPDFARRLAKALNLPFVEVLKKMDNRPEQKTMSNGTQQALNVDGSIGIREKIPAGPVLLVDDIVNSRWTFTIAAWLLRQNGSGEVWPLALAQTGIDE